jgi:Diguanylate cyclase, GGDEF domain
VLLLAATVILNTASIRAAVAPSAPVYSWVIFGAGILLGWRFKRSQLVVALAVLFAAERALAFFPAVGPAAPTGRVVFSAVALLLPLDLAAIAWLSERTMSTWAGRLVLGLILGQPLGIALLLRPELMPIVQALQQGFITGGLAFTKIPPPAILAFVIAIALTVLRFVVRRTVIQASFAWALLAALLGLHGEAPASTVYMATGGLVLIVSLIETSHRMAFSDELTGLPSRRALSDALMRLPELYTVAMIDIDHFKKLNDEWGHAAGDQVLRMIGSTLTRTPANLRKRPCPTSRICERRSRVRASPSAVATGPRCDPRRRCARAAAGERSRSRSASASRSRTRSAATPTTSSAPPTTPCTRPSAGAATASASPSSRRLKKAHLLAQKMLAKLRAQAAGSSVTR